MKQWHVISAAVLVTAVVAIGLWLRSIPAPVKVSTPAPQTAVEVPREQPAPQVADTPPPAAPQLPPVQASQAPPPPPPALPAATAEPREVTVEPAQRKFAHGAVEHNNP